MVVLSTRAGGLSDAGMLDERVDSRVLDAADIRAGARHSRQQRAHNRNRREIVMATVKLVAEDDPHPVVQEVFRDIKETKNTKGRP